MKPVKFKGCNCILGSNQPGVRPLEVMKLDDKEGTVIACFELSKEEYEELLFTRRIYVTQQTFNRGFNPIALGVDLAANLNITNNGDSES